MKSQVNFVYDIEDDPQDEIKHWLFLENVRLQQERQELIEEKQTLTNEKELFEKSKKSYQSAIEVQERKLCRQKDLFEKKWDILEKELRRYSKDREKLAKDKSIIDREKENLRKIQNQTRIVEISSSGFFSGVSNAISLKKRYRDLLKIYHPDNDSGDDRTVHVINQEYVKLKKQYSLD